MVVSGGFSSDGRPRGMWKGEVTFVAGARLCRPWELMIPPVCKIQLEIQTIERPGVDLTPRIMKLSWWFALVEVARRKGRRYLITSRQSAEKGCAEKPIRSNADVILPS